MAGKGKPIKEFHEYLTRPPRGVHVTHIEYLQSPATAFLRHTIQAKNAIDLCVRKFPKDNNNKFTKASLKSLQYLIVASLPTIMGHFETFERYLFAGMFDFSTYLERFNISDFFNKIGKETNLIIDPIRLSSYRGIESLSIGSLLADSLHSWHNPAKVNQYFQCFPIKFNLFSKNAVKIIATLWQLRHAIVHTGCTLTQADSQKIEELHKFGNKQIVFENNFIFEVARKIHPIIKTATEGIGQAYKDKLGSEIPKEKQEQINIFFEVKSSVPIWLK